MHLAAMLLVYKNKSKFCYLLSVYFISSSALYFYSFLANVLMFTFAICRRPSVCLSSVCRLSVTFVHPTQPIKIFGNVSAPCNTLVTWRHPGKILRRSSQGNPSVGGLNQRVLEKMYRFWTFARLYLGNGAR